jgi:hypothetical protein
MTEGHQKFSIAQVNDWKFGDCIFQAFPEKIKQQLIFLKLLDRWPLLIERPIFLGNS